MNNKFDIQLYETVTDQAAFWLVRLQSSECLPEDRHAFEVWKCENLENEKAYLKIQRGNAFIDRHMADPILQQIGEQALEQTQPKLHKRRYIQLAALAATLLMIVSVGLLSPLQNSLGSGDETQIATSEIYETAVGERSTATLTDGTVVTLNTDSRIIVDFKSQSRDVILVSGQAFFDVAKEINRPFSVEAGGKRIVALGTAFDVRLNHNANLEVTLLEGRVTVSDILEVKGKKPLQPESSGVNNTVELAPGERLVVPSIGKPKIFAMNVDEATSWRIGRLVYRGEPIANVVLEMNRYTTQQLKLSDDARLSEMKVSGVFYTGRVSTFVTALERMHPVKAVRSSENEVTIVWNE